MNEWWSVFWDVYVSRTNTAYSEAGRRYNAVRLLSKGPEMLSASKNCLAINGEPFGHLWGLQSPPVSTALCSVRSKKIFYTPADMHDSYRRYRKPRPASKACAVSRMRPTWAMGWCVFSLGFAFSLGPGDFSLRDSHRPQYTKPQ